MKLICEIHESVQYLEEQDSSGKKALYIVGPALVAEEKNKNGRVYRMDVLRPEVNRYIQEQVKGERAVGELGHPQGPTINLERVSHKFVSITESGNQFIAKAKLLDTPMGQIAQNLVREGVTLGFSSRGMGSLKANKDGIMEVQNDFKLATAADIVADPSAPGAFVKGIMENKEWFYDISKGTWIEKEVEPIVESLHKMTLREINERKVELFKKILDGLTRK